MTRILWAEPAIEQFSQIKSLAWRRRVFFGVAGLARFPRRGRIPPETRQYPELNRPAELREIVFPRLVRVFYRYDERADIVRVLAMSFRGQDVSRAWMSLFLQG